MLSKRLTAVASFVSSGAILADIGSDHAYLPCSLILEGRIQKAYACEVKPGPMQSSVKTIGEYQLEDKVFPILSDGLQHVPEDVSEVVIAGMGVHTILSILQQQEQRLSQFHRIIVQANQNVELLRAYLSERQYRILAETIVYEDKFYEVVVFEAGNGRTLRDEECFFGPMLLEEKSSVFRLFYERRHMALASILEELPLANERYAAIQEEMKWISTWVLDE